MNNIEILEERINFCKNNTECREELNQCFGCTFEIEEIQALENLIKDYKKLKNVYNKLYDFIGFDLGSIANLENLIKENAENKKDKEKFVDDVKRYLTTLEKYYIPKLKVKEIIYPTPENPISFELQSSVMYKKLERLEEGE